MVCAAGTAKTTTAAARVHGLIQRGADAGRILATTYGADATRTLKARIRTLDGAQRVQVGTIHHFGNAIINVARAQQLTNLHFPARDGIDRILYRRATALLKDDPEVGRYLRGVSEEEFFTYLEIQKGNLAYASLRAAGLNDAHLRVARQATSQNVTYLRLYQAFETIRSEEGLLTFGDMIVSAWELLLRHPELLDRVQGRYDHVICDEYQDVNLAMRELLGLIAGKATSTMYIGDDDQTIYSWRSSSTRHLREFAEQPDVQTHRLTLNFRSTGNVTALANAVIARNQRRIPKHLTLTKGLGGATHLHTHENQSEVFLREIRSALTRYEPRDIAILIRRYGQTGPLEHMLLTSRIPYRVVGAAPFFERPEVVGVTAHLRLAAFDRRRSEGHVATPAELADAGAAFISAYARPARFISRAQADELISRVKSSDTLTFSRAVAGLHSRHNGQAVARFAADLHELSTRVHLSGSVGAQEIITDLVTRNGYLEELRRSAALPELGEEKVDSVTALANLAGRRSVTAFLDSLDHLSQKDLKASLTDPDNILTFMTAYRAKGQEWPCVFIPDADSDTYHSRISQNDVSADNKDTEEERRVFYVALTRAQRELHLLFEPHVNSKGQATRLTEFLTEANAQDVLQQVQDVTAALMLPPETWTAQEAYAVAMGVHEHHFGYWIQEHWTGDSARASAALHALHSALNASGVTHGLNSDVLSTWAFFGEQAGDVPEGLGALIDGLNGQVRRTTYRLHEPVQHPTHGSGRISDIQESQRGTLITVQFDSGATQRYLGQHAQLTREHLLN